MNDYWQIDRKLTMKELFLIRLLGEAAGIWHYEPWVTEAVYNQYPIVAYTHAPWEKFPDLCVFNGNGNFLDMCKSISLEEAIEWLKIKIEDEKFTLENRETSNTETS